MTDQNPQPLYIQIRDILAQAIAVGELKAGTKVTESSIAARFDVSRQTARNALSELASDDLIFSESGKRGFLISAVDDVKPSKSEASQAAKGNLEISTHYEVDRSVKWESKYDEIKSELLALSCRGRFRIVPSNLAERHGISRTILKDIQLRLVDDGIARVEGRNWILNRFDQKSIDEQFSVRKILEPFALRSAFPQIDLKFASDCLARLEDAKPRQGKLESAELERLEEDLHVKTLSFCDNTFLMDVLRRSRLVHVFNSFYYPKYRSDNLFVDEHIAIFKAILDQDVDAAAGALSTHLENSLAGTQWRVGQYATAADGLDVSYAREIA
jgi:DNA-binding GntR family transcriptional regulator